MWLTKTIGQLIQTLIEAIRMGAAPLDGAQRGLVAGLSDPVLAPALHELHGDLAGSWTVERLARVAAFTRTVGCSPTEFARG